MSAHLSERFASQLEILGFIAQVGPQALEHRPIPGKWSARENLAHIGRFQEVLLERIEAILNQDNPQLASRTPENDPHTAQWMQKPLQTVLQDIEQLRPQLTSKVASLSESDLQRPLVHPAFGAMKLSNLLEHFLVHEGHHLFVALQRSRGH